MEAFLILNGYELQMSDDHIAELFEKLGSDEIGQREFFGAISAHRHRSNLNEPSEP
jgi:prophage maintenance system killer protein